MGPSKFPKPARNSGAIDFVSSHHAIKGDAAERYLAAAISDERGQRICSNENGEDYARLRAALRRAMRGEWYRASETILRRDSLSDFNDGCREFAELRALIVQARATAMNDADPGPATRSRLDIESDELVMALADIPAATVRLLAALEHSGFLIEFWR